VLHAVLDETKKDIGPLNRAASVSENWPNVVTTSDVEYYVSFAVSDAARSKVMFHIWDEILYL
jgi:hypothetical protein